MYISCPTQINSASYPKWDSTAITSHPETANEGCQLSSSSVWALNNTTQIHHLHDWFSSWKLYCLSQKKLCAFWLAIALTLIDRLLRFLARQYGHILKYGLQIFFLFLLRVYATLHFR